MKTKIKKRFIARVMSFFIILSTILIIAPIPIVQAASQDLQEPTLTPVAEVPIISLSITPDNWQDAIEAVNTLSLSSPTSASSSAKPTAVFNLSKPIPINAGVFKIAKGADIDLVFKMGKYSWSINGKSITDSIETLEEVDLTITEISKQKSKDELKKAIIKVLKSQEKVSRVTLLKRFSIVQDGTLPFTATLTMHLSSKYKDRTVFLSYFEKQNKKIKPGCHSLVDSDGNAVFTILQGETCFISLENPVLPSVAAKKTMESKSSIFLEVKNLLHGAEVSFSSNKSAVASVDEDGMITGKKAGTAVITTKIRQGGKTYTFKTKVTVKE